MGEVQRYRARRRRDHLEADLGNRASEFRKALGLDRGGEVVFELENGDIRIGKVREVVSRSQALATRSSPDGGLDSFLNERRREAEADVASPWRKGRASRRSRQIGCGNA